MGGIHAGGLCSWCGAPSFLSELELGGRAGGWAAPREHARDRLPGRAASGARRPLGAAGSRVRHATTSSVSCRRSPPTAWLSLEGLLRQQEALLHGREKILSSQEANAPKKKTAAPAKGGSKRAGPPAAAAKAPKRANAKGW